jgi:protein required for attachment to host cells
MLLPEGTRTWIVMLHGAKASVFESESPGGCYVRVQTFARDAVSQPEPRAATRGAGPERAFLATIANCLEDARGEHRYDRLMLVGAEEGLQGLVGAVSPPTRAMIAAKQVEDLSAVPPEDLRWHVPAGASV